MHNMTVKPEYSKYTQRLFQGLLRVIILSFIWTFLLLMNDFGKVGAIFVFSILGILSLILTVSAFKKSKSYLTEIRLDGEFFVFETNEYDKPNEIIRTSISETRIKLWEIFFPFTKFGRNYKLVIETKQGLTYKRIVQQYEIGNWNLDRFKEAIKFYGEVKGISTSTASFNRANFSTDKI